jgi:ABC-2 type transport system ATP-binding protein
MIDIQHVTKKFPSVVALDDVSLFIRPKEFFGLLGPNGAGKTTLMNLLIGYLDPEGGLITIDGDQVTRDNLSIRSNIGLVPQSVALYDELNAFENLEVLGGLFDVPQRMLRERISDQLNAVGLYERRKDRVKTYSGGMKRRLNLVASLLHDPKVLLLDEPTVGVDPQSRNAIFEYLVRLNKEGMTIVYTTHYMEEAERLCSRIAIIDHGKIKAVGTLDELLEMLVYEDAILVAKNAATIAARPAFEEFGTVIDEEDRYELKPVSGFALSKFFARMEERGIRYQWIEVRRPSLEALFLQLTGRRLRD